ncbi:MAG: glycoside hydrolase family 57 protein [Verrucomicrobiales bacterium]
MKPPTILAVVLHAHLPYVRHPENEWHLEEDWLHEAVVESYLPLIEKARGWEADGFQGVLALSLSPPLVAMLGDELLQQRTRSYLARNISMAEDLVREAPTGPAAFYVERLARLQKLWDEIGGLLEEFGRLQAQGVLSLMTSAATHALLPLYDQWPGVARLQMQTAVDQHQKVFGKAPEGFWLPECGFSPLLGRALADANIKWTVLDAHAVLYGQPQPRFAVYRPVYLPEGTACFPRDRSASRQVWSSQEGYPGDPIYRDFYRDIGWECSEQFLKKHLSSSWPDRRFTGLKLWQVGDHQGQGSDYQPELAFLKAREHARHFLNGRCDHAKQLQEALPIQPVLTSPFDAELFGHWWFEGLEFLDEVVRQAVHFPELQVAHPGVVLIEKAIAQVQTPSASTWGQNGYHEVWLDDSNRWIYQHLHGVLQLLLNEIQEIGQNDNFAAGDQERLQAATRHFMLASASDWAFLMRTGHARDYADDRTKFHLQACLQVLKTGRDPEAYPIFPDLNWRLLVDFQAIEEDGV